MTQGQQGVAIPFIYLQNEKFIVSPQAKTFLSAVKNGLGVLSIVGKYRTGKSLFLNKIILNRPKAFKVSPTINSCTRGLWLWKQTIKFKNQEQQKQILIIDSEGFGATQQSDAYNNKILLFALLLSSYFVYNSVGSIDQNSLNNISVLANLANQIQSKNSKDQTIDQYFPSFLWLVRDFTLNLVDKNDFPIQPKDYLEQALEIQKGTSNLIQGKNKIRRMMKHFFKDRDCFTLVRPVQTQDMLQQLDSLDQDRFRTEFLEQAKQLKNKIFSKIKPKKLKNTILNGQMLVQLAQNYVNVINSNSMPNFENSYKHLIKVQMSCLKKKICSQNQYKIKSILQKNMNSIKSVKQYQLIKQNLLSQIETLTKQKVKSHHSLSVFVNSEQITGLIQDVKTTGCFVLEKYFDQIKDEMRVKYLQIINNIKEDNLMSLSMTSIRTQQQFKQFTYNISALISSETSQMQMPQFFLEQFNQQYLQRYIQSLEEEFTEACKKRLQQENNELKIKLAMREDSLTENKALIMNLEGELKDERRNNAEMRIKLSLMEIDLRRQQEDSARNNQTNLQIMNRLQQAKSELQFLNSQLDKQLELKNLQINSLRNQIQTKTLNFSKIDKDLTVCQQEVEFYKKQLQEKNAIIESLKNQITQKDTKIQNLHTKLQELIKSREQLYSQFTLSQKEIYSQLATLETLNSKLSSELKQNKKLFTISENHHNDHIKTLKENLQSEKLSNNQLQTIITDLQSTVKILESNTAIYNTKEQIYKQFKKCFKNSSSIQCRHCTRFFMSSIFLTHLSVCGNFGQNEPFITQNKVGVLTEEINFKVLNVAVHENFGKPYTVYLLECQKGENKWILQKKFTQFCQFNENLQKSLPGIELSSAKTIFDPKYLSKKSLSVEEKQFLIEKYFNDLAQNSIIHTNKYWLQFITSKTQNQITTNSRTSTKRTVLNQIQQSSIGSGLNYQMRKSQIKEDGSKSCHSKSVKRQQMQTPEEFFKIWEQKQLLNKASTTKLRKHTHE